MFITLFTVILAVIFAFYGENLPLQFDSGPLAGLVALGGTLILLLTGLFNTFTLAPLESLEQKLVPNLMEIYRKDKLLGLGRLLLFFFPVLSFFLAALLLIPAVPHKLWIFLGWMIIFGIGIDLLRDSWKRMMNYLNPFFLVNQLEHEAKNAIQNGQDEQLWNTIDGLAEVTLRSIENSKIALSTQALQAYPPILHAFFASSKSISRVNVDKNVEQETGRDEASYTVFYLLQRLDLINDRALQYRLESVCRQLIMAMGKIIVYSAKFDLSMVTFPTHFLSKFGLKAQQHHFAEVAVLTTSTLLEIAKTIVTEIDLTYAELQEPFRSIINGLDAIAQATFKKDKNTSIKVLIEPFQQLKALFQSEKMAHHPDTPVILSEIDRVLNEYDTLDKVMHSIPPIPDLGEGMMVPPLPPS